MLAGIGVFAAANAVLSARSSAHAEGRERADHASAFDSSLGASHADRGAFQSANVTSNASPTAALTSRMAAAPGVITDPSAVLQVPSVARPGYLAPQFEPTFGGTLRRTTGDAGTTFALPGGLTGTWGTDARHHYSKDQPWNADGTLIAIENRGGSPSDVYLDGETYAVARGRCPSYPSGDDRWHPSPQHARERINANGAELMWYDVVSCVMTRHWTLPFAVDGIGSSEGNPSDDGRFVALSDSARVFVVDMDPQPPLAPYPAPRIGPALDVSNCGLSDTCGIGWVSISPSGKYVVVKYVNDHPRVFDVNPTTLALSPHPMAPAAPRCSGGSAAQGWIYDVGHPDLALNPYDDDEDVLIGQEHCDWRGATLNGAPIGGVVMVRLRDGALTSLTDPSDEAHPHHISARNLRRPGWVYVDYYPEPGARFDDEIVAVKLDGSKTVQRFAHEHSAFSGCYRCESHAVPSPDGSRVIWASNWADRCTTCGAPTDIHDYVVDARHAFDPDHVGRRVELDASGSRDADGSIVSYRFVPGDGTVSAPTPAPVVGHDFAAGTWPSSVVVTDDGGAIDSARVTLSVPAPNRPPNGTILTPAADVTIVAGQTLMLAASANDPDGNTPLACLWNLGGAGPNFFVETPGPVTFGRAGTFVVTFRVTDASGLEDPTPDSLRLTVIPVGGRAPVVSAPFSVSASELVPLSVTVTANDPDGDAIGALTADLTGLPAGSNAVFSRNAANTSGTLTWTPSSTMGRAAPYSVTFRATNSLTGSATTSIAVADVIGPNLVTNPSFESDWSGWDTNGGGVLARASGGHSGAWSGSVTGPATLAEFGLNDKPNIVAATLAAGVPYSYTAWVRSDAARGSVKLRVREYNGSAQVGPSVYSTPVPLSPAWQRLAVSFVPSLGGTALDFQVLDEPAASGESFLVDELSTVAVPSAGAGEAGDDRARGIPLAAAIAPHPVSGRATIRFSTSRPGPLRLTVHDLSGRRVRTLLDERDARPGSHEANLATRGADGGRLRAGVYFWRIEASEGTSSGRIVVLE